MGNNVESPLTSNISIKIYVWQGPHLSQVLLLCQALPHDLDAHRCSASTYEINYVKEGQSQRVISEPSSVSPFLEKNFGSKPIETKSRICHPLFPSLSKVIWSNIRLSVKESNYMDIVDYKLMSPKSLLLDWCGGHFLKTAKERTAK